jgi:hypothetical protein
MTEDEGLVVISNERAILTAMSGGMPLGPWARLRGDTRLIAGYIKPSTILTPELAVRMLESETLWVEGMQDDRT